MSLLSRVGSAADPIRVAVLASGSGSNLQALLDTSVGQGVAWRVVVVVVNVEGVKAADRARAAGVEVVELPHRGLPREIHEAQVAAALSERQIELVVLAGYMRVLTASFVEGCTEHIVDAGVGAAAARAPAAVEVMDDDDEAALQRRIQIQEHRLLPAVVGDVAAGLLERQGSRVRRVTPAPKR